MSLTSGQVDYGRCSAAGHRRQGTSWSSRTRQARRGSHDCF